jgi:hypothetical protein
MNRNHGAFILTLLTATFLIGCMKGITPGQQDQNNAAGTYLAVCEIYQQSTLLVCIDFPVNTQANDVSCASTEQANYSTEGASSNVYIGVTTPGATTSCGGAFASQTRVGSCTLNDRTIRYYSDYWSAATAQGNCSQRSGNWTAN